MLDLDYKELIEETLDKLEKELIEHKKEIMKENDFLDDKSFVQIIHDTIDEVRHHTFRMLDHEKHKEVLKDSIHLTLASELFKEPAVIILIGLIKELLKGDSKVS